ncbi:MAG: cobyrinate a,c-diamide synthase, partial [Nitrospirae bacterium]|nr:cobyrinate a,c-diamide synthase [Nitrospirota bacterium]
AYGMAESAGAVVRGFVDYGQRSTVNSQLSFLGVIFNRVASENHYIRLKDSVKDVTVLGYLPRELDFEIPHRHLGLTVAEEGPITAEKIEKLADTVMEHIDVDLIVQKCRSAEVQNANNPPLSPLNLRGGWGVTELQTLNSKLRIAVAYDNAFCFYYEDNLDLLREKGAEIIQFTPLTDTKIPENVDAIYIGGGYPELYAAALSNNKPMRNDIHKWAMSGKPIYAECGGLMYLSEGIYNFDGKFYEMAGVFPFETRMAKKRSHLGYREILLKEDCIIGKKGDKLRGHEFHYSEIDNRAQTENSFSHLNPRIFESLNPYLIYSVKDSSGRHVQDEGYRFKNTVASYIHIHFGNNHDIAKKFVRFIKEI